MGKNFLKSLKHTGKDVGNWGKHAAEDTFHWGTKTAGKVGDRLLDTYENSVSSITGVLSSPTFLIVAGAVILLIIVIK